jgi:hemerythrin
LIESARQLKKELLEANQKISAKHIEFLERWLTEHIFTTDMRLGEFLYQAR